MGPPDGTTVYPPHWLQAPPANSKELFLGHAALEETYGLAKRSMEVYDVAVRTVPPEERLEVYNLFVSRASQFFGVGKVSRSTEESTRLLMALHGSRTLAMLLEMQSCGVRLGQPAPA